MPSTTKPMHHNYCSSVCSRTCASQQEKLPQRETHAPQLETTCTSTSHQSPQLEKSLHVAMNTVQTKTNKYILKFSLKNKRVAICGVIVYKIYCDDHFVCIKLLCCKSQANIMLYVSFTSSRQMLMVFTTIRNTRSLHNLAVVVLLV